MYAGGARMFGDFTDASKEVMTVAAIEAQRLGQCYIGTEHVFIGLCKVPDPELDAVFRTANLDPVYWRRYVRSVIAATDITNDGGQVIITPRLQEVLRIAERIMRKERTSGISPRQLFLALVAESNGIPVRLMKKQGVNLDQLTDVLLKPVSALPVISPLASKYPF